MSKWTKDEILKIAQEMNDTLGLEPAIPTDEDTDLEQVVNLLREAADLLFPEDNLSTLAQSFIDCLTDPEKEIVLNEDGAVSVDKEEDVKTPTEEESETEEESTTEETVEEEASEEEKTPVVEERTTKPEPMVSEDSDTEEDVAVTTEEEQSIPTKSKLAADAELDLSELCKSDFIFLAGHKLLRKNGYVPTTDMIMDCLHREGIRVKESLVQNRLRILARLEKIGILK